MLTCSVQGRIGCGVIRVSESTTRASPGGRSPIQRAHSVVAGYCTAPPPARARPSSSGRAGCGICVPSTRTNSRPMRRLLARATSSHAVVRSRKGPMLNPHIFRAYDVRGRVGSDINPEVFRLVGRAYGTLIRNNGGRTIAVGQDNRESSTVLKAGFGEGARAAGIDVVDIGTVPTPMLYFATAHR